MREVEWDILRVARFTNSGAGIAGLMPHGLVVEPKPTGYPHPACVLVTSTLDHFL